MTEKNRVWTPEMQEKLSSLWYQGLSSATIARMLNTTKNAVIGAAHRMGLAKRVSPIPVRPRPRVHTWTEEELDKLKKLKLSGYPQSHVAKALGKSKLAVKAIWDKFPSPPRVTAKPKPVSVAPKVVRPLMPRSKTCLWPMWGHKEAPTHVYCGKPTVRKVYCSEHAALAYILIQEDKEMENA